MNRDDDVTASGDAPSLAAAPRREEYKWSLERLAALNRYDIIGRMLDRYRVALDLDDYDDEHANRFRDAALIARELSRMFGVPLSREEEELNKPVNSPSLRDEVAAEEPISSEGATHQLVTPKSSEAGE